MTGRSGYCYNTWIEEAGRTDGNRSSMRYGFLVGYNNIRVTPGSGPAPVQGKGSGIFYHTSTIGGTRWKATDGCTMLGRAEDMKWFSQ